MRKNGLLLVCLTALICCGPAMAAKTWRLDQQQNWQAISGDKDSKYILAVAEFKKLIGTGDLKKAEKAADALKANFSQLTGEDFDAFVKAELLFCRSKFIRAIRAYDALLDTYPQSPLYESALQRQYQIGTAFLSGQKRKIAKLFKMSGYSDGVAIMERIAERAGDIPVAQRAMVAIAESHRDRGEWLNAHDTWNDISMRWPTGRIGEQSRLAKAECLQSAYRGPKYDASTTLVSARSYYEQYKIFYPDLAHAINVDDRLTQIDEQLAYKKFVTGSYYQRTGSTQAAELYYTMVLENWPDTVAAKSIQMQKEKEQLQRSEK